MLDLSNLYIKILTSYNIDGKAVLLHGRVIECISVTLVPSQLTKLTIIFQCYIPNVQSNDELLQLLVICKV